MASRGANPAGRGPRGSMADAAARRKNRVAFEEGSMGGGSSVEEGSQPQYYEDGSQQYEDGQGSEQDLPLHPAVRVDEDGNLTVPPEIFLDELPELVTLGGYAQKKDGKGTGILGTRPWKKVFMRLEGLDLVFYDRAPPDAEGQFGDPPAKELRVFNISKDTFLKVGDENSNHKNKSVRFTFSIFNEPEGKAHKEEDVVHVAVDTAEDREDWLFAINYVIEKILDAEAILENPYLDPNAAGSIDGSGGGGAAGVGLGMGGSVTGSSQLDGGSDNGYGYYGQGGDGSQYGSDGGGAGTGGSDDFYAPPEAFGAAPAPGRGGGGGGGGVDNGPFSLKGVSAGAKAAAARAVRDAAANLAANEAAAGAAAAMIESSARVIDDPEERQIVADEAQCHAAHGPGLYEAVRGEPTHFSIQANDVTGVQKSYGGDPFTAAIVSADMHMDLQVTDNEDGTYTVTYTPTRAGECELQVLYAGANIYGSPFHLTVAKAPTAPNHCVVSGEATVVARPGQLNTFTITTRDQFDDERGMGGDNFIITVAGGGKAHPILDLGNGTYTVSYEVDTQHRAYQAALQQAPIVAAGGPVPLMALEVHVSLMNEGFAYARPVSGSPYRPKVVIPEIQAALQQASITLHTQGTLPQLMPNGALPPSTPSGASTLGRTALASAASRSPVGANTSAAATPAASSMPLFSSSLPANLTAAMQTLSMANSPSNQASASASDDPIVRAKAAELLAKERAVEAGLQAIEDMRRRLEADRSAVDRQMARMQELGMKVREDSERLAEQARALRALALNASSAGPSSGSPTGKNVFTTPGGAIPAVDDGHFHPRSPLAASSGAAAGGDLLFDPEVVALFDKYKKQLLSLWSFYSSLSTSPEAAGGAGLDCKRFLELFADYDIAPTFITRRELKTIFVASARAHGTLQSGSPGGATEAAGASADIRGFLSYAGLVEGLGRAALASLSKPAFAHLYPTAKDRVMVLLEMWGVADARKLAEMQRKPRKHGPAGADGTSGAAGVGIATA